MKLCLCCRVLVEELVGFVDRVCRALTRANAPHTVARVNGIRQTFLRGAGRQLSMRLSLLFWLAGSDAAAAPLFDNSSVLDVTLSGPFGTLFRRSDGDDYLPFQLESGGASQDIRVRLRGQSRRRVCEFPPLRLKFPKEHSAATAFAGLDVVKLVTHCRNHDRGEQDLLEEYLAYRILNVVTDLSYRVRLLRMHYVDTDGRLSGKAANRYGILIEPDTSFAERTGMTPVILRGLPKARHDRKQAALVYVFQYLIANTDYQMGKAEYDEGCCHNVDLYELDGQILVVPYDFDLSGLVNAQYAFPDPLLRIKRVRQRLYRGVCTDREIVRTAIHHLISRREAILRTVDDIPGLLPENAKKTAEYLDQFFEKAQDEDRLLKSFARSCVG